MTMLAAVVSALRAVSLTFDGWYSPIYLAEECTNSTRTVPRAIIGGTLLVAALYVVINLAFLRILPLPVLAASELPAADVARVVLPHGGAELVTIISLLTVLSVTNATLLIAPRILFAIGRNGFFTRKAAIVSAGGTPRVTSVAGAVLIMSGTFEQLVALCAVVFMLNYLSAYVAVFVLRASGAHDATVLPGIWLSRHYRGRSVGLRFVGDCRGRRGPAFRVRRSAAIGRLRTSLRMGCPPPPAFRASRESRWQRCAENLKDNSACLVRSCCRSLCGRRRRVARECGCAQLQGTQ